MSRSVTRVPALFLLAAWAAVAAGCGQQSARAAADPAVAAPPVVDVPAVTVVVVAP
ncbi:MAG: hypothetical protein ABR606_18495 [Vicinamibacterales bacterium]